MPPVHSGMDLLALPAFSPPSGVSVVPSLPMSAADSSAAAGAANKAATASAAQDLRWIMELLLDVFMGRSERVAHAHRPEVAVLERVGRAAPAGRLAGRDGAGRRVGIRAAEGAPTRECRVLGVDQPPALVVPGQAHRRRLGVLVEGRTYAVDVVREGEAGREVAAEERVGVLDARREPVAPGVLR